METTQVSLQVDYEQNLHGMSFLPIHKSIQQIIPWLEQRQHSAKRLYEYRHKLTEAEVLSYDELIRHCEKEICKILNFISK